MQIIQSTELVYMLMLFAESVYAKYTVHSESYMQSILFNELVYAVH